ncbi:hypothetical protein [Micromonospora chersina]
MPEPEWKSIEVVRKELDAERDLQAKIADTADSRAGVVLGFSGAVAGLALNSKMLAAIPGAVLAAAAAVVAATVLWPRPKSTLDPDYLTTHYAARDEDKTKQEVHKRRLTDYKANRDIPDFKLRQLKLAIGMLAGAIALGVAGISIQMIIDAITK